MKVKEYRKKPVVIEAVQWTGENLREVIAFTDGPPETKSHHAGMMWEQYEDLVRKDGLKIYTLEGKMDASPGDWIIKGVKGEFYPCKNDVFVISYEAASGPSATAHVRHDSMLEMITDLVMAHIRFEGNLAIWDFRNVHGMGADAVLRKRLRFDAAGNPHQNAFFGRATARVVNRWVSGCWRPSRCLPQRSGVFQWYCLSV